MEETKRSEMVSLNDQEPFCGKGKCTYKKQFLEKLETIKKTLWRNHQRIDHDKKFEFLDPKKELHSLSTFSQNMLKKQSERKEVFEREIICSKH